MSGAVRVLVVDDDALICRALRRTLTASKFEVVTAEGIAAAKAEVEGSEPFHVVLCDLTLKDGSGAVFVDWLEQASPSLWRRTLVMTGGAMDPAGRKLVDGGRVEVVLKPFDLMWLVERVGAVAARAD
jgi:DNA-binding NtrC family response regulator